MKLKTVSLLFATLGCSLLNRVGPDVTCADLENGAINACKDGIIANCVEGEIIYEVCDLKGACEDPWQEEGNYSCTTEGGAGGTDTPSGAAGTSSGGQSGVGGTSTGGTAPNTGGAASATGGLAPSTGGTPPSAGGTVSTGGSSTASGGAAGCAPGETCLLARPSDMGTILAMAADSTDLVMTDCTTLRAVPVGGGLLRQLDSSPSKWDCVGYPEVVIKDRNAYWNRGGSLVRSPLDGGAPTVVLADDRLRGFAVAEDIVYYLSFAGPASPGSLIQFVLASSEVTPLISDLPMGNPYEGSSRLRVSQGKLVWASPTGLEIVDPALGLARSSLMSPNTVYADRWDVVGTLVAFCDDLGASVADVGSGAITSMGGSGCSTLATNSTHVFWSEARDYPDGYVVLTAPAYGGAAPAQLAELEVSPAKLVANDEFLFIYLSWENEVFSVALAE